MLREQTIVASSAHAARTARRAAGTFLVDRIRKSKTNRPRRRLRSSGRGNGAAGREPEQTYHFLVTLYSYRSASIGSTLVARRARRYPDTSATAARIIAAPASAIGRAPTCRTAAIVGR